MSLRSGDQTQPETPLAVGPDVTAQGLPPLTATLPHRKVKVPDVSCSALSDRRYSRFFNKITRDPWCYHCLPASTQQWEDGATIKAVALLPFESFDVAT